MAIYHCSGNIISRSQGRSGIAAAAYRAAQELHDKRLDVTHDYSLKQDVMHTEILLPEGAPSWMQDRGKLWNAVEEAEKRKDSQLAREFNISLPREFTLEQNLELAREFVEEQFVKKGMVADLCLHQGHASDGESQPHMHVMLTLREVTSNGFGPKNREWNKKENLLTWRAAWADKLNYHLALRGFDLRVDHRSFEAQGINLAPQSKIGPEVARSKCARLEEHQRIAFENGQRIINDPSIALDAMTRQQSTFTHHDLARFVNRHTLDAEQFELAYEKIKQSDELISLGLDEKGRERLTTEKQLKLETAMLKHAQSLAQASSHKVLESIKANISSNKKLTFEQNIAFEHLVDSSSLCCVVGYAGSGKSYLLGAARETWEASGFTVCGMTLSGIAAENLEGSSEIKSRTIASHFYAWNKGEEKLTAKDILVVDEAGMIGSRQMKNILQEVKEAGAKIALIGDPEQLQAIEAGAAFRAIAGQSGYVELTEIKRQQQDWQRQATKELATGETEKAIERYSENKYLHAFETAALARGAIIKEWHATRESHPNHSQLILAATRKDVQSFNNEIRSLRQEKGELGKTLCIQTPQGEREFAINDRIYFLQNDRSLGVKNGTLGTIEGMEGFTLKVRLDGMSECINVDTQKYDNLAYGYAATVHKAQGVTIDRCYLYASRHLDRHSTYVGMSRHKERLDIYFSKEDFTNKAALANHLARARYKDLTTDYSKVKPLLESRGILGKKSSFLKQQAYSLSRVDKAKLEERLSPNNALEKFKKEFERKNADKAKLLEEAMLPAHERAARKVLREIQDFANPSQKSDKSMSKSFDSLVQSLSKQPDVMRYLEKLDEKAFKLVKQHQQDLQKSRGRGGIKL